MLTHLYTNLPTSNSVSAVLLLRDTLICACCKCVDVHVCCTMHPGCELRSVHTHTPLSATPQDDTYACPLVCLSMCAPACKTCTHTGNCYLPHSTHTHKHTKEGEEVQGMFVLLYSSARHEGCALFLQAAIPSGHGKLLLDGGYCEGSL